MFYFKRRAKFDALFDKNFPELRAVLPHSPRYLEFRIRQDFAWGLLISILLHISILLWLHIRTPPPVSPLANNGNQAPLNVVLNPLAPVTHTAPVQQTAVVTPIHTQRKAPHILAVRTNQHVAHPVPMSTPISNLPVDMSAYIHQQRERNHTSEEESAPSTSSSSAEDARTATINRNLQGSGGGGIFQMMSLTDDSATFIFRGFDSATSNSSTHQSYEVESDDHTDIEHAVVRKMIAIIRLKHKGTIQWESQRLGYVVPLSVRPEDNAALESFLLKEFFYDNHGMR